MGSAHSSTLSANLFEPAPELAAWRALPVHVAAGYLDPLRDLLRGKPLSVLTTYQHADHEPRLKLDSSLLELLEVEGKPGVVNVLELLCVLVACTGYSSFQDGLREMFALFSAMRPHDRNGVSANKFGWVLCTLVHGLRKVFSPAYVNL